MVKNSILILIFLILSCKKKENEFQVYFKNISKTKVDIFNDTKIVFVSPDSLKLDSLSKKMTKDEFYKNVQTNTYYSEKFKMYLGQKKLDYGVSNKKYVGFVSKNGDTLVFDNQKVALHWFLLIFDGYNFPTYISTVSIPEE